MKRNAIGTGEKGKEERLGDPLLLSFSHALWGERPKKKA